MRQMIQRMLILVIGAALVSNLGWAQTTLNEGFEGSNNFPSSAGTTPTSYTSSTGTWILLKAYKGSTSKKNGTYGLRLPSSTVTPAGASYIISPQIAAGVDSVGFWALRNKVTEVDKSPDASTWTSVVSKSVTAGTWYGVKINDNTSKYIRIYTTAGDQDIDDIYILSMVGSTITPSVTTLSSFGNVVGGTNSAPLTFTVAGTILSNDITITAPAGFQVSTDNSTYSTSVVLTQTSGTVNTTTIYARFSPAAANGAASGNIACTSGTATEKDISVSGFAYAAEPTTQSTLTFGSVTGTSIVLNVPTAGNGSNRIIVAKQGSAVDWTPTDLSGISGVNANFMTATDQTSGNKVVYDGTGSGSSLVTVSGLTAGVTYYFAVYDYNIGTVANTQNYLLTSPWTGTQATSSLPSITVGSLTGFANQIITTISAEKSFAVSGAFLTDNIVVTPPAGFEISTGTGGSFVATNPITLTPTSGTVATTTIYVRFHPTLVQAYSANITNTSTADGVTQTVAVAGTGLAIPVVSLSSASPAVAAGPMIQGSVKNPIYKFLAAVTSTDAVVNQVTVTTLGTYAASDLTKLQLWFKTTDSLAGAVQLGTDITASLGTGTHVFSGLTQTITAGTTGYFWLTADAASAAVVGNTLSVQAPAIGDVVCAISSNSSTAVDGGIQTIFRASLATDYYRAKVSGNWNVPTTWEASPDSLSWSIASIIPTNAANWIVIGNGKVVNVTASVSVDQVNIDNGGEVDVASGQTLTIANGVEASDMTVNGILKSAGTITTTGVLSISAAGTFELSGNGGTIPTAQWAAGSTCEVTGVVGSAGADFTGLNGVNQTFANFIVDCPALVGKLILTYNGGSFTCSKLTVNSTGSTTGLVQISRSSTQNLVTVGSYVQNGGLVYIINAASSAGYRRLLVSGDFTLNNASIFGVVNGRLSVASTLLGSLYIGGNLSMSPTAVLQQDTSIASIIFNGATAQTVVMTNVSGTINDTINNTAGVILGSNFSAKGSLNFVNGILKTGMDTVILGQTGVLSSEGTGKYVAGFLRTSAMVGMGASALNGIGFSIAAGADSLGIVSVLRTSGDTAIAKFNGSNGIKRRWSIGSDLPPSSGRVITFSWVSDDDNAKNLTTAQGYQSTDGGTTWGTIGSVQDVSTTRSLALATNSFGVWTVSDALNPLPVKTTQTMVPWETRLYNAYPNPFNPSTHLRFTVQKSGFASLKVFDILGRVVATLYEGNAEAGRNYEMDFAAQRLASGLYVTRLESSGTSKIQKLILMK